MKILQVVPFFNPRMGGSVVVPYYLSGELAKDGHDVTIITTDFKIDKNYAASIERMGVKVVYFQSLISISQFIISPGMGFWLENNIKDYEIIHMHNYRSFQNNIVYYYSKKYQIPYIMQAHGSVLPFFQKQNLKKLYDILLGNRVLRDASKVIALTNMESEQYRLMGVNPSKIEVAPNGIDLSEFESLPEKGEFREKYSIPLSENLILFLGRIHAIKGIDLLLDAFADLTKELDNVTLILVGPNDGYLSSLECKIHKLNIFDKVLITGPLYGREKLKAFVDADVYVLPSIYEMFPITILEAFACGTPVVTTDSCGIADIISNNGAGLISRYDKKHLKECISKIISDKELKDSLSSSGKKLVKETFNLNRCTDTIYKIYVKALEE